MELACPSRTLYAESLDFLSLLHWLHVLKETRPPDGRAVHAVRRGLARVPGASPLDEVWELWGFWDLGHQEQFPTVFQEGKQKRGRGREPWPEE